MILILKDHPNPGQLENLENWLRSMGLAIHESQGENHLILGLVGDTSVVDIDLVRALDIVEDVRRIQQPYKKANRAFHPLPTEARVGACGVGARHFAVFAGPPAVESEEQIGRLALAVKAAGADVLTAGAFLSRTSPYAFQGLGARGLRLLAAAGRAAGLPTASEITDIGQLDAFADVDAVIIGQRNMQNAVFLKELGRCGKPVVLRRGAAASVEEWLMSAEYLLSGGNENVILCGMGVRSFEPSYRYQADVASVPLLHRLSHLPVILDPSNASGRADLVPALALAAAAAGADGTAISVHEDPEHALFGGADSIQPARLEDLTARMRRIREVAAE